MPVAAGTAYHALEKTHVGDGDVVLAHGAAGGVGTVLVQLARERGARVIATARPDKHDYLRSLGAEPVAYGEGPDGDLIDRVRALAPDASGASGCLQRPLGIVGACPPTEPSPSWQSQLPRSQHS